MMENSFDNAHFAFVHQGTFGQADQPLPDKYEITETEYGFEAETLITVVNPPVQHRISGTDAAITTRHMRNKWYMPFCRRLDIEYPSGLRHIIFNSATPIDDSHIQLVQWLYRNDTEEDCPAQLLNDWDYKITREDKDIIESTDYDTPIDVGRRAEANMVSDRPGMIMRKRLMKLLEDHGEAEVYRAA
jgi:phenylpropionate dioxygenase-like ring-hydroxylating dioxygenase large terminal subunit